MLRSAEKRALRAEVKRCREGGRQCRLCAAQVRLGRPPLRSLPPAPFRPVVPRWEQIVINWERMNCVLPIAVSAYPEIPSWRDTVAAWQP